MKAENLIHIFGGSKFSGLWIIISCWCPALVSREHISVNRLIYSLINAVQSKI